MVALTGSSYPRNGAFLCWSLVSPGPGTAGPAARGGLKRTSSGLTDSNELGLRGPLKTAAKPALDMGLSELLAKDDWVAVRGVSSLPPSALVFDLFSHIRLALLGRCGSGAPLA